MEDDAAAILVKPQGASSYLFTTRLPAEASAVADSVIDVSSWPSSDLEAGGPLEPVPSSASTAELLPRRRSGAKAQLSAEVELAPRSPL